MPKKAKGLSFLGGVPKGKPAPGPMMPAIEPGGDHQPVHLGMPTRPQALVHGRVLGIDGHDLATAVRPPFKPTVSDPVAAPAAKDGLVAGSQPIVPASSFESRFSAVK